MEAGGDGSGNGRNKTNHYNYIAYIVFLSFYIFILINLALRSMWGKTRDVLLKLGRRGVPEV